MPVISDSSAAFEDPRRRGKEQEPGPIKKVALENRSQEGDQSAPDNQETSASQKREQPRGEKDKFKGVPEKVG